jgi:hypothetical protein
MTPIPKVGGNGATGLVELHPQALPKQMDGCRQADWTAADDGNRKIALLGHVSPPSIIPGLSNYEAKN